MNDLKPDNITLLSELKALYGKLSVLLADIRMRSYHLLFNTQNTFDITSVLNKQLDVYAEQYQKNKPDEYTHMVKNMPGSITATKTENKSDSEASQHTPVKTESEFTKYLKKRKSSSVSQPHIGDNLKASAWEHIHSAIRFAKQGQVEKAKLHTTIAGRALEQAGHYMDDKDYTALMNEIEHYFTDTK